MRNYRIAFFTADWNYELVETTLQGLKQFVADHGNVQVRIFDCFGKDQGNVKDMSEYAIFDLADLSQFDGVLVQGNQIILKSVREDIARRIEACGIPAVTLDCPMPGCTVVGIDNRLAQKGITEHVIRAHGARRLVYLTGMLDNGSPEGRQRLEGFLEACRENGVPDSDIEVVKCTWRTSDGYELGCRWSRERRALPDAFVCANDDMALGLIEGLSECGRRAPQDGIVTGFDGLSSAELSSPRLSTVRRDNRALIYRAMDVLIGKIDGIQWPERVPFDYQLVCSESCGCDEGPRPDAIRTRYFHQTRFLKGFYSLQDQMAEDLFEASDLLELMDIVEKNHDIFGCDNVYLCINDFYFDNYSRNDWRPDGAAFGREMILSPCGREHLDFGGESAVFRFPTPSLLPGTLMQSEPFLMFYPLHYNAYSIGYLVMDGISEAARLNLHTSLFNFLEIAIENVRKKGLLRQLNDTLDELYVHDALTGLYNRFGFERYGQQSFDAFLDSDGAAQVLFVDMDDMKHINDRYGHEIGDAAIRATARVLRAACGPRDFLMRYGGDEFLVIASGANDGLSAAIQRGLSEPDGLEGLPCALKLSIGVERETRGCSRTLETIVQAADNRMYDQKKQKKNVG